jgi:hypothetical protein
MKRKVLLTSTLAVLLAVSPAAIYAAGNTNQTSTTTSTTTTKQTLAPLSVASVSPENKSSGIRPDAPIKVVLSNEERAGVFERGRYQVTINGEQVSSSYDATTRTINIPHEVFTRYSTYTVTVATDQKFFAFNFKTGSEIGEATKLEVAPEQSKVRTTESSKLKVKVTDDYGIPAKNAIIHLSTNSANLSGSELTLTPENNGEGVFDLVDHKKEVVELTVTSKDVNYRDAVNNQVAKTSIEFLAGHPEKTVKITDSVQAGKDADVKFEVYDLYDNLVEEGEALTLAFQSEDLPSVKATTLNGVVSFPIKAPTQVQTINLALSSSSSGYLTIPKPLKVVAAEASSATITLSNEQPLMINNEVHAQGLLTDVYGNPVPNKEITFGNLGTAITNENGEYNFPFIVPSDLSSISLQVEGRPITLTNSNGDTFNELPVQITTEVTLFEDFELEPIQHFNVNGDFYRDFSPNGTFALRSPYIGHGGYASGQMTIEVPSNATEANISLDYLVSSEGCCDHLSVSVDGVTYVYAAGDSGWQTLSVNLSPGTHIVSYSYRKDGSVVYGYDAAFIDNVRLTYK